MREFRECPATWVLIIVNGLIFLIVELTGGSDNVQHMLAWGAEYAPYIQARGEYYRLFTCMFLHFGLRHLGNNMPLLYFVGDYLECEVGKVRFLVIYLLGGFGANCISHFIDIRRQTTAVSAGASGAVFALVGGLIWVLLANRGRLENLTVQKMSFMAALALYFGFASTGVDNAAHVGGFLMGFLLAFLLYRRPAGREWQG